MFNYIKNIYNYLFWRNTEKSEKTDNLDIKSNYETQNEFVDRRLNEWKVKMFSENTFLTYIPEKRILLEKLRLQQEYNFN